MKSFTSLLLTLTLCTSVAVAQVKKENIEVGVQTTSLNLIYPDLAFDDSQWGIGGRVTYNFNRSIAAEAEINFFPQKQIVLTADGNAIQAQFGALSRQKETITPASSLPFLKMAMFQGQFGGKLGKRFKRWGLFGKVRPGFVGFSRVFELRGVQTTVNDLDSKLYPSLDVGGVVEFYVSPRWMARFDIGDTMIHYNEISLPGLALPPFPFQQSETRHNLQLSTGIGFRF